MPDKKAQGDRTMGTELENRTQTGEQETEQGTAAQETGNEPESSEKTVSELAAELARVKADLTKQTKKNDALAKENAEQKRQIRASKSAEEIRDEERKAADEAKDRELEELRKEKAVAVLSRRVISFVQDDSTSSEIAEFLYGAADPEGAVDALEKAWKAREKKLRLEYGKIPAPGAGGTEAPAITADQFGTMNYEQRLDIFRKYPDLYKKLNN